MHTLGVTVRSPDELSAILESGTFPALTSLEVDLPRRPAVASAWLAAPAARQLTSIRLSAEVDGGGTDRQCIDLLAFIWKETAGWERLLSLSAHLGYAGTAGHVDYTITRGADGSGTLTITAPAARHGWWDVVLSHVLALLDAVSGTTCRTAVIVAKPPAAAAADFKARIEKVAGRAGIAVDTSKLQA